MSVTVPYVRLFSSLTEQSLRRTLDQIELAVRKSDFILGEPVRSFEAEFAGYVGVPHAIAVNSGLDALILSLVALGIGPGDEVITAPNSFIASAAAIALVGARPVFVDVAEDYNIDCNQIESAITSKSKAVLPVHLTGNPCDMDALQSLSAKHHLPIIEDAAQSIGATFGKKQTGAFGATGCFSLHPLKNLHVWGDGGVVVTASTEIAEKLKLARNHGLKNRDECRFFSFNSRLDSLQAIVALESLSHLESVTSTRRKNAAYYRAHLERVDGVGLPIETRNAQPVYHVFQVRVKERDRFRAFLEARGVETKIHYPIPLHLQEASQALGYTKGDFPVAERLAGEIVSLPVHESLSEAELAIVTESVREFFQA